MKTLADLGEDGLVRLITKNLRTDADVLLGPGDDCAVVQPPARGRKLVLKTDTLVEGVHFTADTPPALIGRKAIARVLSDFAAMAALPHHALITLIAPQSTEVRRVTAIYRGMDRMADEFGVRIVGGETSRGSQLVLTVSMTGSVPARGWVARSSAKAGDILIVTGTLGGSIHGKHLKFTPRLREAGSIMAWLHPTAMMDISDGLAKDLPRLAASCGLGFELDRDQVPVTPGCTLEQALNDGEDYELLIAAHPDRAQTALEKLWRSFPRTGFHIIGRLVPAQHRRQLLSGGWDHFQK